MSVRTQLMIDATVTTSKSIFLEVSVTHTPPNDSACFLSAIIKYLLFKQTGFFSPLRTISPSSPQCSTHFRCLISVMLYAFPTESLCRWFFLLLVLTTGLLMRCWCGRSLQYELFLHLHLSCYHLFHLRPHLES